MDSAKLVTQLLLAIASLSAAAHSPAPHRHHATASKHQPASNKKQRAVSKHVGTSSKHQKKASKPHRATEKPHLAKQTHQQGASKRLATTAKHHSKKLTASPSHLPKKHHSQQKPASRTYQVIATVYQAVPGQTDSSPFITADNSRIRPRYGSGVHWLALSPDLLAQGGGKFRYGDKVQVGGVSPQLDGLYTVHDTMNRRHHHRIDILTHRREKLHVFAPGARLRLATAPAPRKSRARATAVAHARPGRTAKPIAGHQLRKPGRQQAG